MQQINAEMIVAWGKHFNNLSIDDVPGIMGSITDAMEGKGTLPAKLINGNPIFVPVQEAYYKALGKEVPETEKVPLADPEAKKETKE